LSTLFISDLHLTEERPEANERFIELLEGKGRAADALYILGDFFEYWIGDDDLGEPFNAVIAGLLKDLTQRGVRVYLMHGNRDFLIGEGFCAATGPSFWATLPWRKLGARTPC
jgi:UDP-2,3-diacylglucosamine hydrolase